MNSKRQERMNTKATLLTGSKECLQADEISPVQRVDVSIRPTKKAVKDAVRELNPDKNSMNSRG